MDDVNEPEQERPVGGALWAGPPPDPLTSRPTGPECDAKPRKPCHCTRSQCLKLYCECFSSGAMCSGCDCSHCLNNAEHAAQRHAAVQGYLGRNHNAFRHKMAGGETGEVKGRHSRGCNCKRSFCLKNYCECYQANTLCTSGCKCVGCMNHQEDSDPGPTEPPPAQVRPAGAQEVTEVTGRRPVSLITSSVVAAVRGCLLTRAQLAACEARSAAEAERMVLEEFGRCLAQVATAMMK